MDTMYQTDQTKKDLEREAEHWRKKIRETRDSASEHELYLMLEALMLVEFRLAQMDSTGARHQDASSPEATS